MRYCVAFVLTHNLTNILQHCTVMPTIYPAVCRMRREHVHWLPFAAFWKGWDMTLVILAATPVLAGVGLAIGIVMANLGKKVADAYAQASSIVNETLGNVRTVLAFNGTDKAVAAYDAVCPSTSTHRMNYTVHLA